VPAADDTPEAGQGSPRVGYDPREGSGDQPALLEREMQLEQLRGWLAACNNGRGGIVLLLAGAGLGKTALVTAASELATEAGLRVLAARGGELERQMSFGIARQLFERELAALRPADLEVAVSGAAALALPAVVPSIDGPAGDPDAVVHGLYWLAVSLARLGPLALVVDDAHWADDQSLRWLVYLASRLGDVPVFVLVAGRPAEPGGEWELLARLAADEAVSELELDPLDPRGVSALIERGLGRRPDGAFLDACVNSTGGNPFFVTELVRVVGSAGIEAVAKHAGFVPRLTTIEVARSILARLGRLGDAARRLADAVAVLDSDADARHAAGLAGLSIEEALRAADALTGAGILRDGRPLAFIHPIARAAIYERLPAGARSRAHRRAAQLLADDGAPAERIAVHALNCEPASEPLVVDWLTAAARHALNSGAPDSAARYLERALREPPESTARAQLNYDLGQALVGIDVIEATRSFAQAAATGDREMQVLAHRWRAQTLAFAGDPAAAVIAVEQALQTAGEDPEIRLLLSGTRDFFALAWTADPDWSSRSEHIQQRANGLQGTTPGERRALAVAAFDIAKTGDAPAARALEYAGHVREALATWLDADDGVETAAGIGQSSIIADDPEALTRHERANAEAIRRGRFTNAGVATAQIAHIRFRLGALTQAEADARTSWHLLQGQRGGATAFYWWSAAQLLDVLIARGELAEAHQLVESTQMAAEPPERLCTFVCPPPGPVVLGALALAHGRLEEGIEQLLRTGSWLEERGWSNPSLNPWRALVGPALARTGRIEEAHTVLKPALERARAFGAPWALGMTLRAAGTVTEGPSGIELLHEAIRVLQPARCMLELANAHYELGAKLRRANQRAEAREHLRSGLALAHQCGATPLASVVRDELAATGARPRRIMLTGLESLTASERRVAELAASGLSNPEIAQRLFVTRKTVETHLGHVYLKLDISSRHDLAATLQAPAQMTG
jgi:DNA-binding CsgD family transcriptional regulator